ncbi:MAG: uroporphyrinogen-III C-methyltransferase [Rhodanobacteraceae bacterium]
MGEESENTQPLPAVETAVRPVSPAPVTVHRGATLAMLIALAALLLGAIALWRAIVIERGQGAAESALRNETTARLDELARNGDQRKRDLDALRARVADTDSVNKSVREELLALGERSRHLEDAVANLAEQRLTGRDALALNEAEFLLQLGQERLGLFYDAQAALAAYKLADSALAAAEDPVFASVRQTISAEMQALEAAKPLETRATLDALERIRTSLATLPSKADASAATKAQTSSRFAELVQQFVRVRTDTGDVPGSRDLELSRSLAAIDLRAAEAALIARDPTAYANALSRTRASIANGFDPAAVAVTNDLAEIDRLAAAPLAPNLPELGSALRELRNLRATRALSQPRSIVPAADGAGT